MYTLLLPGRSHAISDEAAARLLTALGEGKPVEVVPIELNGEGSGAWDVALNVRQVIALVKHPHSCKGVEEQVQLRVVTP